MTITQETFPEIEAAAQALEKRIAITEGELPLLHEALTPKLSVALHCGSVSAMHVDYPRLQKPAARATAEVVLPHPPF
jgi:hypothetical protein